MKIMVSAGEVSGDIHAAALVHEIKNISPNIYFFGMGAERLKAEGVDIKFDISRRGTIGIFEALPNILPIYSTYRKLLSLMKKENPDLLLLIDSQGINMPLATAAKKLGIRTAYYIAPQEWLWGTQKGVKRVANTIDLILAIFKKEYDSYLSAGAKVVYFGHPLLDIVKPSAPRDSIRNEFMKDPASPLVAICPGSRRQELSGLLPVFLESFEIMKKDLPNLDFIIPAASREIADLISNKYGHLSSKVIVGRSYDALNASDLAICASGTVNLEASILGVPNIMAYKLSRLSYFIGKYILKIDKKIPFFSMPNIILNEKIIPELIMNRANPQDISRDALRILKDKTLQEKMKRSFIKLKAELGVPGVLPKLAKAILGSF